MIAPIDFGRLENALGSPRGWLELAATLLCIGLAFALDRWFDRKRQARGGHERLGSVVRLGFPLLALTITFVAAAAWRRYVGEPLFLSIAIPILVALAVIRVVAYGLRRLFPAQAWLRTGEVAISTAVWVLAALYFVGVLSEMTATLDQLVLPIGKSQVTVLTIFKSLAVVTLALVLVLWVSGLIEQRLARATQLDVNLRALLAKSIKAVLIVIGVLISLEQIGFDLTLLTVFGGALGVGIGLGLQKLASNYIAGFAILLDRSIRLGDLVTVDNRTGVVTRVTSRYVVIRGGDGLEAIVPNEALITNTVLNHSSTATRIRIAIQVQVSYDSDVEAALGILREVAGQQPEVLGGDQAPSAMVINLADSGITLELGVWIDNPHIQGRLKSALYRGVLKAFAAQGIDIPYPRRDVRITGTIPVGEDLPGDFGKAISGRTNAPTAGPTPTG
jgi:small-conductance mechanosensitive channel